MSGGPIRDLARIKNGLLWDLAVDGSNVAWEYTDENDHNHIQVRRGDGTLITLPGRAGYEQTGPDIRGDWVVYADVPGTTEEFSVARVMRYNLETGASAVIASVKGVVESSATIYRPQIVGDRVVFLTDQQYRLSAGIATVPLAGGKLRILVREDNKLAPVGSEMTANEQLITWETFTSFESPSTIYTIGWSGGPMGRVSCGPGSQHAPMAAEGKRIIWLDTSSSNPDLVTRATPRVTC